MRQRNRNRFVAVGALLVAAIAVAALLVSHSGGDDGPDRTAAAPERRDHGTAAPNSGGAGGEVRNASPQPDWEPYLGEVPIFRYHAVGEPDPEEPFPELWVSPLDFEAQMEWLGSHGYEAVDLRTVERAWEDGGTLPRKPFVLSFDGDRGELTEKVFPELRQRGWPGVLVIGGDAPADDGRAIGRLLAAGWEPVAEAAAIGGSRQRLEAELGTRVENFSYPQGKPDESSLEAAEEAGYAGATAAVPGFASGDRPFELPRITVFGLSRIEGFVEALRSRGEGAGA